MKFAKAEAFWASVNWITEYSPFLAKILKDKSPEFVEVNFIDCLALVVPAISLSEFCIPSGEIILFELILIKAF